MKKQINQTLHWVFNKSTRKSKSNYKEGLRPLVHIAFTQRYFLLLIFAVTFTSGLFEVGSIGLLYLAVDVLLGEKTLDVATYELPDWLPESDLFLWLEHLDRGELFLLLILVAVGIQLFRSALDFSSRALGVVMQRRASETLQKQITRSLLMMDYQEVIQYSAGRLNENIRLGDEVAALILTFSGLIQVIVLLTFYVGVMFMLSVPLTILSMFIGLLLSVFMTRMVRILRELGNKGTDAILELGHITVNFLNAPRLVRIFNISTAAESKINTGRSKSLRVRQKVGIIRACIEPSIQAITITGASVFLVVGFLFGGEDTHTILPKIVIFLFIFNRMIPQVQGLNARRMVFALTARPLEKVGQLLNSNSPDLTSKNIRTEDHTFSKHICFENVSFQYSKTSTKQLHNLNFRINKGEVLAIVGKSGSGKSTLVDLILGLINPSQGRILVDDIDLQDIKDRNWLSQIGVVDQDVYLLNDSVFNNIVFERSNYQLSDVQSAAQTAHAHEFIVSMNDGYNTILGDRGVFLSGGQKQRISIARALLSKPRILVLDEATSSLDSESELQIKHAIEELSASTTVMIIAHRFSTLSNADNIIVLRDGKLVEYGAWTELNTPNTYFYSLWMNQQSKGGDRSTDVLFRE